MFEALRRLFVWFPMFADDPAGGGDGAAVDSGDAGGAEPDGAADSGVAPAGEAGADSAEATEAKPTGKATVEGQPGTPAAAAPKKSLGERMLGEITKGLKEADPAKPVAKPEVDPKAKAAAADPKAKAAPDPKARQPLTAADLKSPDGLDPKSAQRFQKLATGYSELEKQHKEVASKFETLEADRAQFAGMMAEAKVTHEDLGAFVEYNKAVKTGNYESAMRILDQQREAIAKAMGKELPGTNLLADFPDLEKDVAEFKITKDRAIELATVRRAQQSRQQQDQTEQARKAEQEKTDKAWKDGQDNIAKWAKDKAARDIDYAAKEPLMLDELDHVMRTYSPERWIEELERSYRLIRPAPARAQPAGTSGALRPAGGAGSPAPDNLRDAMFAADGTVRR